MSHPLSPRARYAVLFAAFGALLFDGLELGLMPLVSLSVSKSLLGTAYTATLGGDWFARFTAALMAGAAVGGITLGALGDRIGRTRAMGVCILFYSVFAALGAYAQDQWQMLALRKYGIDIIAWRGILIQHCLQQSGFNFLSHFPHRSPSQPFAGQRPIMQHCTIIADHISIDLERDVLSCLPESPAALTARTGDRKAVVARQFIWRIRPAVLAKVVR